MAADDIEGFKYFHPHLEIPEIKLTPAMADAVKSVLMGEDPEHFRRRKDMESFKVVDTDAVKREVMERALAEGLDREASWRALYQQELPREEA